MYEYTLGQRCGRRAAQSARRTAICFGPNYTLDSAGLNQTAPQWARLYREYGVNRGDVVCISGAKTPRTFAAILACLKIGAIYSVFDPDSPTERMRKIFAVCRPKLVLGEAQLLARLHHIIAGAISLAADDGEIDRRLGRLQGANLPETRGVTGSAPAYIMFTS